MEQHLTVSSGHPQDDTAKILDELGHEDSTRDSNQPAMVSSSHGGHKRSISGSIMARLPFLRPSDEEGSVSKHLPKEERKSAAVAEKKAVQESTAPRSSLATAVRQSKTRTRKGSLRKTAILGTREKRGGAYEQEQHLQLQGQQQGQQQPQDHAQSLRHGDYFTHTPALAPSSGENTPRSEEFDHNWSLQTEQQLALDSSDSSPSAQQPPPMHPSGSPVIAPMSGTYTSTTDDDEGLTFSRPSNATQKSTFLQSSGSSSLLRRRSTVKPSPLTRDVSPVISPSDWDYSETEWWGWVILVMTWLVFVVGMGSCLGVWSWAWDVGDTPRAPPELEDDPTLPIVGYYPALMVLTAVMAWVWVIVAWVGIKTFRHAKVVGDE